VNRASTRGLPVVLQSSGMNRKYQLRTLGCKVNQYESQQLREILESHGWRPAGPGETADLALVNGCAVTGSASAKTRQAVRRVSLHGIIPVIVVGCGAGADADRLRRVPGVIAVWGHRDDPPRRLRHYCVHRLQSDPGPSRNHGRVHRGRVAPNAAHSRAAEDDGWMSPSLPAGQGTGHSAGANPCIQNSIPVRPVKVNDPHRPDAPIHRFDGHVRAFLKVQDGCDAYCTYCIIPRLRPTPRSRPVEAVVAEAEALVRAGHREIVLTGIYLGAYGRPTAVRRRFGNGPSPLAELVDAVAGVEGLVRLRLSSLEPGDVDDHLLEVLAAHDCCVPHLHLPLQAGSSQILRRMNRQYDADDFLDMIRRVNGALDRPAISTDVLVGFPGETDDDFDRTLEIARQVGFCKIHAFPFSPREQTAAARWTGEFVPPPVVRERMTRLQELERRLAHRYQERFIGTVQRVLVESGPAGRDAPGGAGEPSTAGAPKLAGDRADGRGMPPGDGCPAPGTLHGRTDRYFQLWLDAPKCPARPGDVVFGRVDRVAQGQAQGTLVGTPRSDVGLPLLSDYATRVAAPTGRP